MRGFVLLLAIVCAALAIAIKFYWLRDGQSSASMINVAPTGLARLVVVLVAVWIAWPVVRKPAMWLPSGALLLALVVLGACVVQPRLAIALVPAASAVIGFAAILRFFRGN